MTSISICDSEDKDGTTVLFPIPQDQGLTLDDLRSAFPRVTSLRYKDQDESQFHHVLCRSGRFVTPDGGWNKTGRIYTALSRFESNQSSRFGIFESYRRRIRNRQAEKSDNGDDESGTEKASNKRRHRGVESSLSVNVRIGHGYFKSGVFTKFGINNATGYGGYVVVGPFSKTANTAVEIKKAAFKKFCSQNRRFRQKYQNESMISLVYPDGTVVNNLPDNSAEFSLEGYRNFLDPQKRFDRLRFYLCDKSECLMNTSVEISTDSSTSSDELPAISIHSASHSLENVPSTASTASSGDDTLPLVKDVTFHYEGNVYEMSFPHNCTGRELIKYISGKLNLIVRLTHNRNYVNPEDRLLELTSNAKMEVYVEKDSSSSPVQTEENDSTFENTPVSGEYLEYEDYGATQNILRCALEKLGSTEEPTQVLRVYRDHFLCGRALEITDIQDTIEGDTSLIFVGRYNLWEDANAEIKSIYNLRHPLEVQFYGEESADYGGPRKEFFRLALDYIKTYMLVIEDQTVTLKKTRTMIQNASYFTAGVIVALSALQNGPCAKFLAGMMDNWPEMETEEYIMFRQGLERVGLWQLIREKPTLLYLFRSADVRLTVQRLISLLEPQFCETGTNARRQQEKTYGCFIRFVRQVAAGRQGSLNLGKILAFTTGAEDEPVLGFELHPTITFQQLPGDFPTASTCINQLTLPMPENTEEKYLYDRFEMAFHNDYFGMQ